MPDQFQFMALIKGIGTKQKGEGKETVLRMIILPGFPESTLDLTRLVGKAVNVTVEGSQRSLDEA